jgi:hypothetical protein
MTPSQRRTWIGGLPGDVWTFARVAKRFKAATGIRVRSSRFVHLLAAQIVRFWAAESRFA